MTLPQLPPVPAAREKRTVLAVTAGLICFVLVLLVALAWWAFSGKEDFAAGPALLDLADAVSWALSAPASTGR